MGDQVAGSRALGVGRGAQEWIRSHPLQSATTVVVVLASFRLAIVARLRPETMASLLQHSSFTVIGGTVIGLVVTGFIGLLAATPILVARRRGMIDPASRRARLSILGYLLLLFLIGTAPRVATLSVCDQVADSNRRCPPSDAWTWELQSAVQFGFVVAFLISIVAILSVPVVRQRLPASPTRRRALVVGVAMMGWLLWLTATGVLGSSGLSRPWQIREIITYRGGEIDGFVIEDAGEWMTVMRHDNRAIVMVRIDDDIVRERYYAP